MGVRAIVAMIVLSACGRAPAETVVSRAIAVPPTPSASAIVDPGPALSASATPAPRVPCADCAPVELLPVAREITRAVVDADGLYFFEGRGKSYRLLHLESNGSTTELAARTTYGELRSDANAIYWVDDDGVYAISKSGGPVRTLASESMGPHGSKPWLGARLVVDDAFVYWSFDRTTTRGIRRVPKQGGVVETLGTRLFAWVIAVDATTLYWVEPVGQTGRTGERGPSVHALRSMPKQGGAPALVHQPLKTLVAAVADDDYVYWIGDSLGYLRGSLFRVPKRGGKAEQLASPIATFYNDPLVVDGGHVYWLDFPNGAYDPMRVMAVAKQGGPTVTLAAPPTANKILLDATRVYWADHGAWSRELPW